MPRDQFYSYAAAERAGIGTNVLVRYYAHLFLVEAHNLITSRPSLPRAEFSHSALVFTIKMATQDHLLPSRWRLLLVLGFQANRSNE